MSSVPRSDAPSPEPEALRAGAFDADLVRERGADLLSALESRLPGARAHANAAASWALAIGVELGLERERALALRETARLHAIGMLYLPGELLGRPEWELTGDELRRYDGQAEAAARLAAGAGIPPAPIAWLAHWRERYDGRGRLRVAAGELPIESRIIRVACAFDAGIAASRGSGALDPAQSALAWLGGLARAELDPGAIRALGSVISRV